jgi:probable HAF family extracellular repeat protein
MGNVFTRFRLTPFASIMLACSSEAIAQPHGFHYVPSAGTLVPARANAVSANGSVVVGDARGSRAFMWTKAGGLVEIINTIGGTSSKAHAVSADGTVVVGTATDHMGDWQAYFWTNSGGMIAITNTLGGSSAQANDVSMHGTAIVGSATNAIGHSRAFIWTPSVGMAELEVPLEGPHTYGEAISDDGVVVAGWGNDMAGPRAFRWRASGPTEVSPFGNLKARGLSGDGEIVVGAYEDTQGFRWLSSGTIELIESPLGTQESSAFGASFDGGTVVGVANDFLNFIPFRWTIEDGLREVRGMSHFGGNAFDVSADGQIVVGRAFTLSGERAFWADYSSIGCAADFNTDGMTDILDFLEFVDEFASCQGNDTSCWNGFADINGDDLIDILDFLEFLDKFGCE